MSRIYVPRDSAARSVGADEVARSAGHPDTADFILFNLIVRYDGQDCIERLCWQEGGECAGKQKSEEKFFHVCNA